MSLPKGFQVSGLHCGIKSSAEKPDLSLFLSTNPAVAAGVYTQNRIVAASVVFNRARTPAGDFRAVLVNSGNANACTGERGWQDVQRLAAHVAQTNGLKESQVLVLSTGIIGEFLPMEKLLPGVEQVSQSLGTSDDHIDLAGRGMMTTDTRPKLASRTIKVDGQTVTLSGFAKGAAMIGPNMATMLAVLLTDASLTAEVAQKILAPAVDQSFNCLSVDGHSSTNDTVLLLANGQANPTPLKGRALEDFRRAANEVCEELAKAIADDGEGTTHVVTIEIVGCSDVASARKIAKTVANSPLVKTAIAGADPNWGRIVSAAGYAEIPFDPSKVTLHIQGTLVYENGTPVGFDESTVSAAIAENRDVHLKLGFGDGSATARFWTTDLTAEYVRLNADYHT